MPPPPPQFPPWRPTSTVSAEEARKFAALANEWWDPKGPFAPLHDMNPVRCRFLRSALCSAFGRDVRAPAPLAGLRLLDVGCGGGLLAESLARMGAHVTGIDVNEGGIATAEAHAALDADLAGRLTYRTAAAEQLVAEGASFDAVIASEVIEHVASLPAFCGALDGLTRPGGGVAISTLNRTPRSFALAVVAAEYVLRWVPPGTHDWERFITPEELAMQMEESTGSQQQQHDSASGDGGFASTAAAAAATLTGPLRMRLLAGMEFNPLARSWSLGRNTAVNYIAWFDKPAAGQVAAAAAAPAGTY
ncbi:ubiquinone biosynthesis O-methyltransferase [Micractinium conductrix]|uniref:Ubiquinone biosynthesis O-methyltransferase, mitochondrial n=1 Tax=Micractinium conductrix TaxID=554055 RepID=A0A2P6VF73_9CHLO|nr:ubiquinone biosynthesis O-methyltransferase [Micractinium conductrix]|eukprot:PSC72742.1 ubiquinone biosynthesis O-methyltransferase [Micractinium conductrix]